MANQYLYSLTDTWNSGATTFAAIKMNVTDSASAADSKLLQLQIGGNDKFAVGKDGSVTLTDSDAGASSGPTLALYRDSGTPAASDVLGRLLFQGEDDAGNTEDYAEIYTSIGDPGSGSEDGALVFRANVAGTMTALATLDAAGLTLGTNVPIVFGGTGAASTLTNLAAAGTGTANTFTMTQTWTKGSDVASSSTLTLGDGNYFDITGTTTVTAIATKGVGTVVKLHFDAALTLTHHATDLFLNNNGANIVTAAGDEAEFIEYATGDWRCTKYTRANGKPINRLEPYEDLAVAASIDIGATASEFINLSATATISVTALGTADAGTWRHMKASDTIVLVHDGASQDLPSDANITVAPGDTFEALSLGSGNWKIFNYTRANGTALVSDPVIGTGQTWQDVTGSRAVSTSYQNTTGQPIEVSISGNSGGVSRDIEASTDDMTWVAIATITVGSGDTNASFVIPDDHYYRINGSFNITQWSELRA